MDKGKGKYLAGGRGQPLGWLKVTVLLVWDGMLLYMIADCLIEPVWGGVFIAAVSMYLGYQL